MAATILPLSDPPIIGYNYLAYPLSIMANHDEYLPWFHSNYIQLCCSADFLEQGTMHFDFYNYDFTVHPLPWLDIQRISRNLLSASYTHILHFLKDSLDRGLYVYLFLDEYYLSNKASYRSNHFYHDNFIFGYDDGDNILHTAGFDKTGIYKNYRMPFVELEGAYNHVEIIKDELDYVHLFQFKTSGQYDFDVKLVIRLLKEFIDSDNTSNHFSIFKNPKNQVYGIKVYHYMIEYLESLLVRKISYDIRPFHILWEHKKCMKARIKFIEDRYELQEMNIFYRLYEEIEQLADVIRITMIKFDITKNQQFILNNIGRIREMMQKEREVLGDLLNVLEKTHQNQ